MFSTRRTTAISSLLTRNRSSINLVRTYISPLAKAAIRRLQTGFVPNDVESIITGLTIGDELQSGRSDLIWPSPRPIIPSGAMQKVGIVPLYHYGSRFERVRYWQDIPGWRQVTEQQFLSYGWNVSGFEWPRRVNLTFSQRPKQTFMEKISLPAFSIRFYPIIFHVIQCLITP